MADPVLTGGIRVQCIFGGYGGLPEDRYVTTWAFSSDVADTEVAQAAAIAKVRNFYSVTTAFGGTVMQYLAGGNIVEANSEFRAYYLGDPPNQREPYIEAWGGGTIPQGSQSLPSEVAVCLSYYAGTNRPRNRGRVYIGPLNTTALTGDANMHGRPTGNVPGVWVSAAEALIENTTGPRWSVIAMNETTGVRELKIIDHAWCDNAFDTVRKRGEDATGRLTYP